MSLDDEIIIENEIEGQTIQPSVSGFSGFKKDECEIKDIILSSVYCPTCVIDEAAPEIDCPWGEHCAEWIISFIVNREKS